MPTARKAAWFVALGAVLWATDTAFRQPLTETIPASVIVLYEHLILAVVSLPLLLRAIPQLKKLGWKGWLSLIFIGVGASALATVAFTRSFVYGNPTVSILLQKVQPIVAILLAHFWLKERLRDKRQFWFFTVLALIGGYVLSFEDLTPFGDISRAHTMAIIYALVAAVLWGSATVFGRFVLGKIDPLRTASLRFLIALPVLLALVFFQGEWSAAASVTAGNFRNLIFMALVPGFIAMAIYYRGLKNTKASIATIAELAFPVSATVINWVFLGYGLTTVQILGAVVLLLSIFQLNRLNTREQVAVPAAAETRPV